MECLPSGDIWYVSTFASLSHETKQLPHFYTPCCTLLQVVLVDEGTSSDGEGFSRGVSELGLGTLIGTRTWGGGIWLSSDNTLVDGGIASAPEIGTYNNKFGWGMGIENEGVEPDVVVDNNPREAYDGIDLQLQEAITYLQKWLKREPIVLPKRPG